MTNRMWNTALRIEDDEQIEKSKMLDGKYQVRKRGKKEWKQKLKWKK